MPVLQASHVHGANRNRGGPETDGSNRIYRQGYEFFESLAGGEFSLGLNFVSFQRDLNAVRSIPQPVGRGCA